jgi:hypothetical protein
MIGSLITTYRRPRLLAKTLPYVVSLGSRVLVVDDGSPPTIADANRELCEQARPEAPGDVVYLHLPENRGLAGSLGVGLEYLLCDRGIDFVSYFQDDVEGYDDLHDVLLDAYPHLVVRKPAQHILLTGHDAREHQPESRPIETPNGIRAFRKRSCRATHMFAHRDAWASVLPIRSKGLGFPKRILGTDRGEGSDVDWWITRDHPTPLRVWCVPGLLRTFSWRGEQSCWNNTQVAGEDEQLSRQAVQRWKS